MRRLVIVLALLMLIVTLVAVGAAQANKPLDGITDYEFKAADPNNLTIDPQKGVLFWEGTVTGEIEGIIRWWGWEIVPAGKTSHYEMSWNIEDGAGNLLLAGVPSANQ